MKCLDLLLLLCLDFSDAYIVIKGEITVTGVSNVVEKIDP